MIKKNNGTRKVQMLDIARLAGVSAATVSRALSNSPLVNEETRHRIVELAQSLNYKVNVSAQSLRLGNNRTIGVVIPYDRRTKQHVSDPFFLGMLGSLADALTDLGYDMLLLRVDSENLIDLASVHTTGRAGGIIVIGQWGHHDHLNELAMLKVPIAVWGAQLPRQLYCSVGSDNFAGGKLATSHLLSQGKRRIVFLGDTSLPEVELRYRGYMHALHAGGIEPDGELLVSTPFTPEEARSAVIDFLDRKIAFDGIFAASDLIAMTAMGLLSERGVGVPEQVGIVGYDDIEAASHCHPSLTTVKQPLMEAGKSLVEVLELVMKDEPADSRLLPTSLVVRESSQRNQSMVSKAD